MAGERKRRIRLTLIVGLLSEVNFLDDNVDETSSDDNDDANIVQSLLLRKRKRDKVVRISNYVAEVIPKYTRSQFQSHFRIAIESYEALLQILGPKLNRFGAVGRNTIPVEKQLLSTLWLLATPDSFRSVGERFDMGKSSCSVSFFRIIRILSSLAKTIIVWPSGDRLQSVERNFFRMSALPNIIGAVDGTYVPIKAPRHDPEVYITRKCTYAITLQAICDSNLNYTDIYVGYPGSVSDARIFKNSDIYKAITANRNIFFPNEEYIVGDKAYPPLCWCIAPYIDNGRLTEAQRHFNSAIAKARQVIERSFALLFGRFRRLKYLDMNRTDLVPITVLSCCVLHNICLKYDDELIFQYIEEGFNNLEYNNAEQDIQNIERNGRIRRDEICLNFYNQRNI